LGGKIFSYKFTINSVRVKKASTVFFAWRKNIQKHTGLSSSPGESLRLAARPHCGLQVVAVKAQLLQRGHTEPLVVVLYRE
jgi:hypothetical protein